MESGIINRIVGAFIQYIIVFAAFMFLVVTIAWMAFFIKRWHRRRKADRRIIREAKAMGIWDRPHVLGGRALELKAWEDFKIRRLPNESDVLLRYRYKKAAELLDRYKAVTNSEKVNPSVYGFGMSETDTPREGGSANEQ